MLSPLIQKPILCSSDVLSKPQQKPVFHNGLISTMSGNINNTASLDPLYRGLVTLLDWSLPRLAPDGLVTAFTLS